MYRFYITLISVFLILFLSNGSAQQMQTYIVKLGNLLQMQQGFGWPLHLRVAEGNEALMKLSKQLVNQQACEVTTPTGVTFDVSSPPDPRYERWSDGCGVRVRRVTPADVGRWRLTASRGNDTVTGWSELYIQEDISNYTAEDISLLDGQTHAEVELSTLNNSYCLVAQPFSDSSLVPGHCSITLDKTTRAVQGRWSVWLGIPGQVEELHVDRNVAVEAERLDVGYVWDSDNKKLHLYCNILHTTKNITFCRFHKSSKSSGFNIMDGLSDGRHSYYGDGFLKKHCGMTIEHVNNDDFGSWRCTVGAQERVGTTTVQSTPMQALISVPTYLSSRIVRENSKTSEEVRTLFVEKDTSLTITCRADASLAYCWFQHPNGSQFTPVERQLQNVQHFWYTGENLQTGDCGITFAHVNENDAGLWTCHMGFKYQLGVEVTDKVNVRVTGALAANKLEVGANIGREATLYCHTSNRPRPLDYCRFLTPSFVGMSVDSSVTSENAILNRFYFTPERNLDFGDCSLTINPVLEEDIGEWICAALLHDGTMESRDTVKLYVAGRARSPQFMAGMFGMTAGIILLAAILAGVLLYRKGKLFIPFRRRSRLSSRTDAISLETRNERTGSMSSSATNNSSATNSSVGTNSSQGTSNILGTNNRTEQNTAKVIIKSY